MSLLKNKPAAFVMPHWTENIDASKDHLELAFESIHQQTDTNWHLIIIDDSSPCNKAMSFLKKLRDKAPDRVSLLKTDKNAGPGFSRNLGVELAYQLNFPIILYNDADDLSHKQRLEYVRKIFIEQPETDVVYSTFIVIDEKGDPVLDNTLTGSILEILEGHNNPLQGNNIWINIGTERGYTNLTSSTAVRTELAYRYPFPKESVSEDYYAWMMYSAGGREFTYCPEIPSQYRIPQNVDSSSRARESVFYQEKARMDEKSFRDSIKLAAEKDNHFSNIYVVDDLWVKFYIKLSETLFREKEDKLAMQQIVKACSISYKKTEKYLNNNLPIIQQ